MKIRNACHSYPRAGEKPGWYIRANINGVQCPYDSRKIFFVRFLIFSKLTKIQTSVWELKTNEKAFSKLNYKGYYPLITTAWNKINNNLPLWLGLLRLSSHQLEKKDYQHHFSDEKY